MTLETYFTESAIECKVKMILHEFLAVFELERIKILI